MKKIRMRTDQENYDAIMDQGEMYLNINDGYEQEALDLAKDIRSTVKRKFSGCDKKGITTSLQSAAIGNSERIIPMVMVIQGVGKTGLESVIEKLNAGSFGRHHQVVSDMVGYPWEEFNRGDGKDFVSGVTEGLLTNIPKVIGLSNLMLNGSTLPEDVLLQHNWLRNCSRGNFLDCKDLPFSHLQQKCRKYLDGSRTSKRGLLIQKYYGDVLTRLGVDWEEKTACSGGHKWDIVINNPLLFVEISFPNSTGNHITTKGRAIIDDARKSRGISVFLGGGTGWSRRPGDVDRVSQGMDMCFGPTREESLDFFSFVVKDVLKKRVSKAKISQLMEEVRYEAEQNIEG